MQDEIPFGEWLRKQRRALDLSRQAFADQVGCAEVTLRRIEAGTLKPSKELANILLEKLGIPESERLQWISFARGISDFPSQSILSNRPATNLPVALTSFVGREKEQVDVIQLITKHRLVTLTGAGGIGKSRLAIKVGEQFLGDYSNGVWLLELAALNDPVLLPQTAAALFGLTAQSNMLPIDLLINFLHTKSTVLILDNCEHLLDACAHFSDALLKSCLHLKILATSREPLDIAGEALYRVPSLKLPDVQQSLDALKDFESVTLFKERAQLAQFDFALTLESASYVAQICRRLDGIPLAIELAAAKVSLLSTEQIAKQLEESFNLLTSGSRTSLPRHQTLRASMNWSWSLLTDSEQTLMRQLSVFAGGWTIESAQVVCDGDVLNSMNSLVKKSLIVVNQDLEHEPRYRLHEVVRQSMHELLLESGQEGIIQARHLQYFLQLSEQAKTELKGPAQVKWMSRLKNEHDNVRAALEWADQSDVEAGLYLSGKLSEYWENFDPREGAVWLERFIQKPESKMYPLARANALCTLGRFVFWFQRFAEARTLAQECLDLYKVCGDKQGEVDGLLLLAEIFLSINLSEARELIKQALSLARSVNDVWRTAFALLLLGWDRKDSYFYVEEALSLFRGMGDLRRIADCMAELGRLKMLNNDLESAQIMLNEARTLIQELDRKSALPEILESIGRIAAARGDYDQAYARLQEAAAINEQYGYRTGQLWTRSLLGYLAWYKGNIGEAHDIFTETARSFFNEKNEIGVIFNLEGMAALSAEIGKPEIASKLIGWADTVREKIGNPRPRLEQADVDRVIASCIAKVGEVLYAKAYEQGRKMTLEEAVDLALKKVEEM